MEEQKHEGNFFTDSIDELMDKRGGSRNSEESKTEANGRQDNMFSSPDAEE